MAHRRLHDIDYADDKDDYDETYEEKPAGTSAEDQEQLRVGTIAVREELGEDSDFTTDKEIQDALWYYYYDIEKSVAYLRKQRRPAERQQTPKKQKPPSKFDQAAQKAGAMGTNGLDLGVPLWSCSSSLPEAFFADTPFLDVPAARLGHLSPPMRPQLPRYGLLGGASNATPGKPSKLAALAAKKKKAAEDKRKAETEVGSAQNLQPKSSLDASDRNGKRQKTGLSNDEAEVEGTRLSVEDMNISNSQHHAAEGLDVKSRPDHGSIPKRAYPRKELPPPEQHNVDVEEDQDMLPRSEEPPTAEEPELQLQAMPSSFAGSLFARSPQASETSSNTPTQAFDLHFPVPDKQQTGYSPFSGPSPDDVVIRAQQGKGSNTPSSKSKQKTSTKDATKGIKNLKLDDSPPLSGTVTPVSTKVKSKNLDVAAEYAKGNGRRSANFVVIGHVDHGKSTLMGRILHDTSYISSRDFSKLSASAAQAGKSSFNYAWLMDSTAEERSRGITVDIAHTSFSAPATDTSPATDFNILDAPGHKDFVPNMIAGAAQADFAVLVVDASNGEFEKGLEGGGQTKEHALLVRGLGVSNMVVAVNKMDQSGWNEGRFHDIEGQISAFLSKIGYRKEDIRVVPCAGLTGENVVFRIPPKSEDSKTSKAPAVTKDQDRFKWYTGPTLLASLSAFTPQEHNLQHPFRMTISDIFRGGVTNPLSVSGRLDAGTVQIGDSLLAMPSGETCAVRGIEVSTNTTSGGSKPGSDDGTSDAMGTEYAVAGQIATLHLTDIDPIHLKSGDVLCSPSNPVQNVSSFTAKVLAFEHLMPGTLDCHRGRLHCSATVTKLLGLVAGTAKNASNGAEAGKEGIGSRKPRIVKPGQAASIAIELERPLPLEKGTRIVLRSEGTTVAAGRVE